MELSLGTHVPGLALYSVASMPPEGTVDKYSPSRMLSVGPFYLRGTCNFTVLCKVCHSERAGNSIDNWRLVRSRVIWNPCSIQRPLRRLLQMSCSNDRPRHSLVRCSERTAASIDLPALARLACHACQLLPSLHVPLPSSWQVGRIPIQLNLSILMNHLNLSVSTLSKIFASQFSLSKCYSNLTAFGKVSPLKLINESIIGSGTFQHHSPFCVSFHCVWFPPSLIPRYRII